MDTAMLTEIGFGRKRKFDVDGSNSDLSLA